MSCGCYRFDDVLVGAPLYFKGSSLPEVGAVYIYENTVNVSWGVQFLIDVLDT